jgi:hypothetical protein
VKRFKIRLFKIALIVLAKASAKLRYFLKHGKIKTKHD